MEPYKKSVFAAPKSLRSPEQPRAILSPEEGEAADSRCTSLTKVRFSRNWLLFEWTARSLLWFSIDVCLIPCSGQFEPVIVVNQWLFESVIEVSYYRSTVFSEMSIWVNDRLIARSSTFPRNIWLLLTWTLPIRTSDWFCFFPYRRCVLKVLNKLSNRGEWTDR